MKNFKKLLVTLLALVLLICGATVVSLAADTPAEIIAEAQILLDQATQEDGYIAVRSQKMRELDQLINSNYATIKNSQEWRDFQIGYRAAQEQLKEDSVAEAAKSMDRLFDKETSAAEASALYSGLSQLLSLSGDGRGYFDTDSEAFAALNLRMKVGEAIAKLQAAEDTVVAKDKGAALLWISNYKTAYLDEDASVTAGADYALMNEWFNEIYAVTAPMLYSEIRALTDEACLSKTTLARGIEIADEIDSYFSGCYFKDDDTAKEPTKMYAAFARVYVYLNEIERTKGLLAQGAHLKTLVALRETLVLDNNPNGENFARYEDFTARYNALLDIADEDSVLSRLCALANGYKKDVADVFTEGYTGALKDAAAIRAVVDELDGLIATCYFPTTATYANDLAVASAYAKIYDFYVAMKTMDTAEDAFITRNRLYKAAIDAYAPLNAGVLNAEPAYRDAFLSLYNSMTSQASLEITNILNSWLTTAQNGDAKDEAGEYKISLDDAVAAYNNLQTYYITKDTALYFRATEDKTVTAKVKQACQKVEERLMQTLADELLAAKNLVQIPEELATVDPVGLAEREAKLDALLLRSDGLAFSYVDAQTLALFRHDLIVSKMLTILCKVEIEYAKGADGEAASVAFYNELKTFAGDHLTEIDTAAEDYAAYLLYLNKAEVKMGNANVPGARPYLDALAAVVDADNFDKVYALMHLQEYMRQNSITRPDPSDTTSASALFYAEYDALSGKVAAWRKAIKDAREALVPLSDYSLTGINEYNMEDSALTAALKAGDVFIGTDKRYGGANGSETCATIDYLAGKDTYFNASLPSSTANIIFEMDLTTFTSWPKGGVSFNSKTKGLTKTGDFWPWIGMITGDGQLKVPVGSTNNFGSNGSKVVTNREGGYIIPGQWTHFVIVYNAMEKTVSYYINDERIVGTDGKDTWSCAMSDSWNFEQALRIGNSQDATNAGSFSIDNLQIYVGDQPRNINLFSEMSDAQRFVYYTNYAKKYIDSNGATGTASDAKLCYDEAMALHSLYWGIPEGATEKTYLFDPEAEGYVDGGNVTYAALKQAVDDYLVVAAQADTVIDNAMVAECFKTVKDMIEELKGLTGIDNLNARKTLLDKFNAYIEANVSYLARLNATDAAAYEQCLKDRDAIVKEIEVYSRANEYIAMVNKLAAARDLYSRTVYRAQAQDMMKSMETDASLGYFDLEEVKADVAEFAAAIELFAEQSKLLDDQLIRDNNEIIIDCMGRFPATPEEAMKNYAYLNKYIVLVRSILLEGDYDAKDAGVQEALAVYKKMNDLFYDALQKDHAASLQALIDQFNTETAYITRLGIYTATKSYLEQNKATIDRSHDAIKGIYSQYEIMHAQFGSEAGREEEWIKYGETLQANTLKFVNIVMQMRFSGNYEELLSLREQAAAVYYYMDSTTADAQLAVEYYHTYEKLLTYKALCGDAFIDAAYALKKAKTMEDTYLALLAAKAAYELADTTYKGALTYTEQAGETTYTVTFSMQEAVETYTIALSQYNSFVTVINGEVNVVLDIVCAVRASFSVNQPIVALFKKFYD